MILVLRRFFLLVLAFSVIIIALVFLVSPKSTKPFENDKGEIITNSIAEIQTVTINDVPQRVLIRGKDKHNRVLLHIHGGPGGVDQAILRSRDITLEDLFTVVYWDQRGAGASYSSGFDPELLSLENIVKDGIELSEMLKQKFGKDKIYLEAHSWGTLVGIHMIDKRPDLYHAYFGVGQIANSKRAESMSYDYALNQAN